MKKIAVLAPANSIHTKRWIDALSEFYEITLFSIHPVIYDFNIKNIVVAQRSVWGLMKISVLLAWFNRSNHPIAIHAHYASSYGLILRFARHRKKILSVWGSDVYEFPEKSIFHQFLIRWNLKNADVLTSTSHVMAKQTSKYTGKPIHVVPFGVDTNALVRRETQSDSEHNKKFIVGTVKTLSEKYGIDILIKSIAHLKKLNVEIFNKIECRIYGLGPDLEKLRSLALSLDIAEKVRFCGFVDQINLAKALNELDVFLALSRWDSESFGVSVIEAQACGLPVIVTNVGGLMEVVENNKTGLIVSRNDYEGASKAIISLCTDEGLASRLASEGRKSVENKYDFTDNVQKMMHLYEFDT